MSTPTGFTHQPRGISQLMLFRGAALRESIAWGRNHPADYRTIKAIRDVDTWGLPPIGDVLDEGAQAWMAYVALYAAVHNSQEYHHIKEAEAERLMRSHYAHYLRTIRQDLEELAAGCAGGHADLQPDWLAALHSSLVTQSGWTVTELVEHVMRHHRNDHPGCTKVYAEMVDWVASRTPLTPPLFIGD